MIAILPRTTTVFFDVAVDQDTFQPRSGARVGSCKDVGIFIRQTPGESRPWYCFKASGSPYGAISMNRVFEAPTLVLLLFLTSCGSPPQSIVDPQPLTLALPDMSPGYTQGQASYGSTQTGNMQVAVDARRGRVAIYHTDFKLSSLAGLLEVQDSVAVYGTTVRDTAYTVLKDGVEWHSSSLLAEVTFGQASK